MSYRDTDRPRPSARARRAENRGARRAARMALATAVDYDALEV